MVAGKLAVAFDFALLTEHACENALWLGWAICRCQRRRLARIHDPEYKIEAGVSYAWTEALDERYLSHKDQVKMGRLAGSARYLTPSG